MPVIFGSDPVTGLGGTDISGLYPESNSVQSSSSSGSGSSGINWKSPFMKQLYPALTSAATGLPGVANNMANTIQGQYSNLMRQAMGPNAFQGTLNSLSNRGMLNSNVASDSLATAGQGIAQGIGNQAFTSQLAGQQAQMQVPDILTCMANLGQESKNTSRSSSSGMSSSWNPLAPYELGGVVVRS